MLERTACLAALLCAFTVSAAAQTAQKACLPALLDAASPSDCIPASTVPTPGALLPLGPEFFVAPTGEVGVGTMSPGATLDVAGDLRVTQRAVIGNSASFGPSVNYTWLSDLTHTISDFSGTDGWNPLRSYIYLDPSIDQVGPDRKYVYAHDLIVQTVPGNDKQVEYFQGPYMAAWHNGTGIVRLMAGAFAGTHNSNGVVESQIGCYMSSVNGQTGVTVESIAAECQSGHWGTGGSIERDYGLMVSTPFNDIPLTNHYGIFLEDQDRGEQDSYAIYSAGGTNYLAGDLGIGTDTPAAKLDVNGDFVASGTKSFVQPHPFDATKEIRFVCLEGNEAGTYFRGRAQLVNGVVEIVVPEDFALVSEVEGMTVQLTARGPGADLWVAESGLDRIVVRGERDVEFDYFVNGVRSGYAGFETIRNRAQRVSNAAARAGRGSDREEVREVLLRRMRGDE